MNEIPTKLQARAAKKNAKRDTKKRQIADSAISALQELGYANTSLRDIAEKSDMSLGMLHYYFEDRTDLIIYCVRIYKDEFVRNIMDALDGAQDRDGVIEAFSGALVGAIMDDAMTHRLWYDIRSQAMFDEKFRPVVDEIEQKMISIVGAALVKSGHVAPQNVAISYGVIDGVFRYLMQGQMGADRRSRKELSAIFQHMFGQFL